MRHLLLAAALALGTARLASAEGLVPGWITDPTALREALGESAGYQPPEQFKYPYVSTYYVKPTVTPDEDVKVGFFVTDFESSKIRFLDDSHRFTAYLEYRPRGGASTVLTLPDLRSGDAEFNLGKLPVGAYELRVWAKDAQGRESHRVIQDFRVMTAADQTIPADKVYRVTAADLAAYGIRNDGNFEKVVHVATDGTATVVKDKRTDVPGYTVTVPLTDSGAVPYRAYEKSSVAYDAGYDTNAVEQAAVTTAKGIQKLINDKAAAGIRKVILPAGTYRVSHAVPICIPDNFTFDLGEATIKLNPFTGEKSIIFRIASAVDAHLVGGVIEGDYWAHDYAGSIEESEWVSGVEISGDSWYCSFDGVTIREITGYGGQNGIGNDDRGSLAFIYEYLPKFVPGGLDPKTGAFDAADTNRYVTDFKDIRKCTKDLVRRRFQICKYLGYQGVRTRSWQMTVAWYDADKKFMASETSWQYREMWIPEGAAYLRVSVEAGSDEEANPPSYTDGLLITSFRYPINCAVRNCTFERCRCVGYAASQMKNWIFEGNYFTTSGEAKAKCAFDAEDGADQMQDTYFLRNKFRDNPINNSILTCSGHNFILEKNDGGIYFWGRTHSPCVRDNDVTQGTYWCDSRIRSGYGRFEGNRYSKGVRFGMNDMKARPDNWDYVLSGKTLDGSANAYTLEVGKAGRVAACTLRNMSSIGVANAHGCTFENCKGWFPGVRWLDVTVKDSTIKDFYNTNSWERCHFENSTLQGIGKTALFAKDCDFAGSKLFGFSASDVLIENCTFSASTCEGNWWDQPTRLLFRDCAIATRDDAAFLKIGVYTFGDIRFEGCTVSGKQALVNVHDLRPHNNTNPETTPDRLTGTMSFKDTAWNGAAATVVAHGSGKYEALSSKQIVFVDKGNAWPDGVAVVTDLFPTWKLVTETPEEPEEPDVYDYYVSPRGDDAADGKSRAAAFATVAKAVEVAQDGETVGVLEGTYEIGAEIVVDKAISIVGKGWGQTIIRPAAGKSIRCITLDGGARLEGVTLTGGNSADAGAGAWVKNGTISRCCIRDNATTGKATSGGGVSFTSGQGAIDHCIVTGNTIDNSSWGGGIGGKSSTGTILIDSCLVYGNEDKNGSGGGVGFQNCAALVTVRNCTITENKGSGNVGGLYFNDVSTGGKLILVNDIIANNKVKTSECNTFIARKYFDGAASSHCLITGTQEQFNGDIYKDAKVRGLFANAASVVSADPAFADPANHDYHLSKGSPAIRKGVAYAGIAADLDDVAFAAKPSIGCYEYPSFVEPPTFAPASGTIFVSATNVTLTCATAGATIRYTTDGSDPTASSAAYGGPIALTQTTTVRACAFKDGMEPSEIAEATYLRYEAPEPPVLGAVTVTPRATSATLSGTIVSLGNNGATACDVYLALGAGGAAKIAAGVTGAFRYAIPNLAAETTYGYVLSVSNNAATPMGAAAGGTFTTTAKSAFIEPTPGNPALTWQTVQEAIDASPAGTVALAEGLFEIDRALSLTGGVTLQGQGWAKTVIRQTAAVRCATVDGGARIVGVTLTGGNSADAGAGAWVKDGTLSWCCVSNNATTGGGTSGGGVSFTGGQGKIDHCIVTGNTITGGSWGGGIGGKSPAGAVAIDTCLIYGNEDKNGSGGGVGFDEPKTAVAVRNCTITGNKCSNGNGHGLYFNNGKSGAKLVLVNVIASNNKNGTSECNLFVQWNAFDGAASSNCLVTGSAGNFSTAIYKDVGMRGLIANVLSDPPAFADAAKCDYRLAEHSPAIGAGVAYAGIGRDLDGLWFAVRPSIGCYEWPWTGTSLIVK